jgi:hypothetical protein
MARPSFSLSALSGRARVGLLVVAVVVRNQLIDLDHQAIASYRPSAP